MTLEELARHVQETRDAQKAFWTYNRGKNVDPDRKQALLIRSKSLETMLDAMVEEVLSPGKVDLFSGVES